MRIMLDLVSIYLEVFRIRDKVESGRQITTGCRCTGIVLSCRKPEIVNIAKTSLYHRDSLRHCNLTVVILT